MSGAQEVVLAVFGILAGFAVGSFICVVIERMPFALPDGPNEFGDLYGTRPWGEVLGGSSRCSDCEAPITPLQKVPVLSWLALRGKCKSCGAPIPGFHPAVEALVPLVGVLMVVAVGWGWRILPVLWLVPVAITISAIDFRTFIVPTRIVWPAFAVSLALSVVAALVAGEPEWLLGGLVGIGIFAGPLFVIWFAMPGGMGFGDVRLAVLLGWTIGFMTYVDRWTTAMFMCIIAMAVAAAMGIILSVVGITARGRKAKVPFGPSLAVGAFLAIAFSSTILKWFELV